TPMTPMYSPVLPPMPPATPPTPGSPPVPGDYSERLFGYLQQWRQHLEQMTGTASAPAYPVFPTDGLAAHGRPPTKPLPPDHDGGKRPVSPTTGETIPTSGDANSAGDSNSKPPPSAQNIALAPSNAGGSQFPGDDSLAQPSKRPVRPINEGLSIEVAPASLYGQAAVRARGEQMVLPPAREFGPRANVSSRTAGGPRSAPDPQSRVAPAASQVNASAQIRGPERSRFKGLAERAERNLSLG